MLMEFSVQLAGARIPLSSKIIFPSAPLITESWVRHSTVSKAVFPRGTRRGTGMGSRPIRWAVRTTGSSGEDAAGFLATAMGGSLLGRSASLGVRSREDCGRRPYTPAIRLKDNPVGRGNGLGGPPFRP